METSVDSQDPSPLPISPPSHLSLFRNILTGSSIYGVALVAPMVASVLLSPITTRCLTQNDFGVSELLTNVASVLSCLLSVNLSAALGYFYFGATDAAGRRNASGTAILGSALLGTAAAILCWPLAPLLNRLLFPDTNATGYLRFVVAILPGAFTLDALLTWLRVENRSRKFVIGSVLRVLLTIAGTLLFVQALRRGIWGVLITSGCAIVLVLAYLAADWLRHMKPAMDAHLFASMAKFSLPITASAVATFFLHFGDRFFLPHYRPFAELAVYSIAYKIGMVMSTIYGAFSIYWNAQVFPIMRREDSPDVFRRISTYVFLMISLMGLGLVVFSQPAIHILYRKNYWGAAGLVPILVLAYFCRSIWDFIRCLFLVEGRPGYDAVCTFMGTGICLAGYILLIPRFGIWGAAIATVIAFAGLAVISLSWTHRLHRYSVDTPRLIKIAVALAVALALHWLAPGSSISMGIARGILSVGVFCALLWMLRFPTPGEWKLARAAAGGIRARLIPAR